ncbi:MAG: hypothetical protein OEW66_02430 [Actinomycetota bacterium]|nr:hypothetical protein [Actinomycetota bacterium]
MVLRIVCAGRSCDAGNAQAQAAVPFCRLPKILRHEIAAGYRAGRSPDVMGATEGLGLVSTQVQPGVRVPWAGSDREPEGEVLPDTRVPIAFVGGGIRRGEVPAGSRLDVVASTLEGVTGLKRAHPEVRTGEPIPGVVAGGKPTPLVVVIAWKGLGTPDLEADRSAWPFLRRVMRAGAGTLEAATGSLPLDPAATITTIGTGGLPSAHGVTGTTIRRDDGRLAAAWSSDEAGSVIATFADDLDRDTGERARVAAILSDPADRGIIGNGWYLEARDDDRVAIVDDVSRRPSATARTVVRSEGLGTDRVTDMLGVVLRGRVRPVDAATAAIVRTIRAVVPGATFAIAGTGSLSATGSADAAQLARAVDSTLAAHVVAGLAADGVFLDRDVLVQRSITSEQVADALRRAGSSTEQPHFSDVYPSFAVEFSRYC